MPFVSKRQARYLFSVHPLVAKRWAAHTPDMRAPPERVRPKADDEVPSTKEADLLPGTALQPHQERVADTVAGSPGRLLVYQGLGSGKSLSALAAADRAGDPYTAVVPASLRPNLQKEQKKFLGPDSPPGAVISYSELAKRQGLAPHPKTLLFDEAQNLANPGTARTRAVQQAVDQSRRSVFMSATPIVNHPSDFATLHGLLTGEKLSPEQFAEKYVREEDEKPSLLGRLFGQKTKPMGAKNLEELTRRLRGKIDYHEPDVPAAQAVHEKYDVPMSKEQANLYRGMYERIPFLLRQKMKGDYPVDKKELARLTSFLTGPRQVGLSVLPFMKRPDPIRAYETSPKLQKAVDLLKTRLAADARAKALVFSNYVGAGLGPYQAALERDGIPSGVFHGGLTDAARKKLVDDYNADRIRVALLGPSGTEGLSFKGTRLLQRLDPHWHSVRGRQAEGRGVRMDSHLHLPVEDRSVTVQDFRSRLPGRTFGGPAPGVDEWMARRAEGRDRLNRAFLSVLKQIGRSNRPT